MTAAKGPRITMYSSILTPSGSDNAVANVPGVQRPGEAVRPNSVGSVAMDGWRTWRTGRLVLRERKEDYSSYCLNRDLDPLCRVGFSHQRRLCALLTQRCQISAF